MARQQNNVAGPRYSTNRDRNIKCQSTRYVLRCTCKTHIRRSLACNLQINGKPRARSQTKTPSTSDHWIKNKRDARTNMQPRGIPSHRFARRPDPHTSKTQDQTDKRKRGHVRHHLAPQRAVHSDGTSRQRRHTPGDCSSRHGDVTHNNRQSALSFSNALTYIHVAPLGA